MTFFKARPAIWGLLFFCLFMGTGLGWMAWRRFALQSLDRTGGDLIVDVAPGTNFIAIRKQLSDQGLQLDPLFLRLWIRSTQATQKLRVGEYRVDRSWSQKQILDHLLTGDPILHKLIIKEGHSLWDIRQELTQSPTLKDSSNFLELVKDPALLQKMGVPRSTVPGLARTLEGFLFPETYAYTKYDHPKKLVEAMLEQFNRRAKPLLEQHPWGKTPEGRYRLLTLASIVEKESGHAAEQPLIAAVFWNRLKKKMRLQSDPTTIYGLLPNFDGNLTRQHLLTWSPYNTYKIPELPVGPISNPGESAIRAVVSPATTDDLFFVAKGDGTHVFSKDYATHTNFVKTYQLKK